MFSACTNKKVQQPEDWLIDGISRPAEVIEEEGGQITLSNGLVQRRFVTSPNVACYDYVNLVTGEQLVRAVMPEARISLNGKEYKIGGLYGQEEKAYFKPEWLDKMTPGTDDFQYTGHKIKEIEPHFLWRSSVWTGHKELPKGKQLVLDFEHADIEGLTVHIHYELYDNIPLTGKYLTVENKSDDPVKIDQVVHEILAMPEEESAVVGSPDKIKKPHHLYLESNYAFNNAMKAELSDQTAHWKTDSTYTSQVNYDLQTPVLLEVYPDRGIGIVLEPGTDFKSIRTYELARDSYDRERNGLARRKMYRTLAPWTTQNPIFMHLVSTDPEQVRTIIDQCAETGYEGVILSFGSGLNMEDTSPENIKKFKELADYAHGKEVLLGGYSLFSSRSIGPETDVIDPETKKPGRAFFNNAPCLASEWGLDYLKKIKYFFEQTGFDIFENDGPYPGDVCASTSHEGHRGLEDSQWVQMELQKELYHWMNKRGIYINAPDWYFLDGSHKIGLGYREVNFALPRERQMLLNRQNIYDGTWEKTPSMGWGFVPLTAYHGGGPEAVLEPLDEHLSDYRQLMMQYYGAGVQACYRGPRLYDTEKTKNTVIEVIDWYRKYRSILNADIIHLRRPDGRDWDGILHVDPDGEVKGLAMLYNPLNKEITREITLPLYYTGLQGSAEISMEEGKTASYDMDNKGNIRIRVTIPPGGYTWLTVR
ncbi:alpha-galactosidase [Sinomicrobium sp. FJxs]|uniref:Alpha-galactosidase n=1 Tax=Sinomicrobium weinanense TaxID=2842200 RepID=A0A926Q4T4_9FLAO|nr:alpha-galactosidase [Sinomicrobium weinanense]